MLSALFQRLVNSVRPRAWDDMRDGMWDATQDDGRSRADSGDRPTGRSGRTSHRWLDSLSLWLRSRQTPANSPFTESTRLSTENTQFCPRPSLSDTRTDASFGRAGQLPVARRELGELLEDIHADSKRDLQCRIRQTGSLHELWQLRAEVFQLISLQYSQGEAARRIAALNRHFPANASRFGDLMGASRIDLQ